MATSAAPPSEQLPLPRYQTAVLRTGEFLAALRRLRQEAGQVRQEMAQPGAPEPYTEPNSKTL